MLVPDTCNVVYERVQDTQGGAHMYRCDAMASYALYHVSGGVVRIAVAGSAIGTDKQTTSALTACHKLAMRQLLMLATGEDNEKPPNADELAELFDKAKSLAGSPEFKEFVGTHWKKFSKGQQNELAALNREKSNGKN
jgi:hypothetical protein